MRERQSDIFSDAKKKNPDFPLLFVPYPVNVKQGICTPWKYRWTNEEAVNSSGRGKLFSKATLDNLLHNPVEGNPG